MFGPGLQVNNQQAMKLKHGQLKVMMPFASFSVGAAVKGAKATASRRTSKDSNAGEEASTQGKVPRRRAPRASTQLDNSGSAYGGGEDFDLIDDEDDQADGLFAYGEEREAGGQAGGSAGGGGNKGADGIASQVPVRAMVGGRSLVSGRAKTVKCCCDVDHVSITCSAVLLWRELSHTKKVLATRPDCWQTSHAQQPVWV